MKRIYWVVMLIFLIIYSCKSAVNDLKEELNNNPISYGKTAIFLEQVSEAYQYASITKTNDAIKLVVGNDGKQSEIFLKTTDVPKQTINLLTKNTFVFKQNQIIYFQLKGTKKHGVETSAGILKNLQNTSPKIPFSWVKNYSVEPVKNNWFVYQINNK